MIINLKTAVPEKTTEIFLLNIFGGGADKSEMQEESDPIYREKQVSGPERMIACAAIFWRND